MGGTHIAHNREGSVVQVAFGPDDSIIGIATSRGHVLVMEHNAERLSVQAQRLQLSYEHKGTAITCLQWNGTGSRLFVGDSQGKVSVLNITVSKTKSLFQPPPNTLMRLDSKIVQLDFAQDRLLASTLTRCYLGDTLREKFAQVGKKLRDGEFGCCFLSRAKSQEPASIYVARPGCRLWEADLRGSVLKTHQFKDSLSFPPAKCVSYRHDYQLSEGGLSADPQGAAFRRLLCLSSSEKAPVILSWSANGIYIIDPRKEEMILWTDDFKDIIDIKLFHNRIYIHLANNQFHVCSLLSLENAVTSLFQWHHFSQCAQFLLANHHCISKNSFQQKIPAGLILDLMDGLTNEGRPLLSSRIAKLAQEKYDVDLGKRPPKGKAIPRLAGSPRHVRCHSSERVANPKLSPRIPRRGSDPSCWTNKTSEIHSTTSSSSTTLQVASKAPYDNGLSEPTKKLDTLDSGKPNTDLPSQPENLNQKVMNLVHLSSNNVAPEMSGKSPNGQMKPSCSANGKCSIASRTLAAIPASPLESPLSPLDGVDPDVLSSIYAEQDVGYESVYQYLNLGLYGAGVMPSAFSVRPSELMQLANVADLSKIKETLSSKYLSSKENLLKNLRGFESRIKYFGVETGVDVVSPGSPVATVEESCIGRTFLEEPEKMVTPQDDLWLFLPPLGANLTEATLKASETLSNPQVLFSMPQLSQVLNEWVTVLHSSHLDVLTHVYGSTDPSKLLDSCFPTRPQPADSTQHSLALQVVQPVFTSDPFYLSREVKTKAKQLAMLCFQMDLLGDMQAIEQAITQHKDSQNRVGEAPTERNLLECSSSNSFESEDTSTRCDLSLSMRSSPSEKQYLSGVPTLDSCSESTMFQSTSSSLGCATIGLDFGLDNTVGKECGQTSVGQKYGVVCSEAYDTSGAKLLSSQCSEDDLPRRGSQGTNEEEVELPIVAVNFVEPDEGAGEACKFIATKEPGTQNRPRRLSLQSDLSMTSQSDVTSLSWMPMVQNAAIKLQSPSSKAVDTKMSCFIRNYFYLLDVETVWEIVQATREPCYQSWSAAVAGLCKQAMKKFLECGVGSDWIVTELEKVVEQPAQMLGYLAFLHQQDPDSVEDMLLKRVHSLTARDILYFSRYINAHPSLFIKAMHRAFIAFPLPQMLSSVRKYLENNEVRWEWVNHSLESCDLQCLKCPCGAPRTWSHRVSWPDYLYAVLLNDQWVSIQSMQVCQLYGFWPGYLYSLKHLGFRLEHLITIIQLGDVELLSSSHQYGLLPESEEEWKLAFELVQKQQKASNHSPTCLFCDQVLDSSETLVTVENLARRMLDSLGLASEILDCLPKGSLSPHFFFSSTLITIIGQQQQALNHRILSRLESYLWSRRPVCVPPQIVDVLEREKQGLASMEDLTDVQVHHLYGEEADGHWGRTTTLLSSCASCRQLLFTSCNAVVVRQCGHTFHDCCLLGDFCVVCLEAQGTG
ncbi:uncharacterized protein LOC135394219 isoform X2 [Ornithodoros turicata]|uniref:uncharacterized protein LOC135394219 isoform X2 n=1 Tax=Ornithodoros turicata TaxID=34597 RepID=UPI003138F93F